MDLTTLGLTTAVFLVFVIWWKSTKTKARALELAKRHCTHLGLQFLDQSVVLNNIRTDRFLSLNAQVMWSYGFEFTSTGEERYRGKIVIRNGKPAQIELETHRMPTELH